MAKKSAILNVADGAVILGVSPRRVRAMITAGLLPATKVGRDYIIQRADIEKIPKTRKPGPKPKAK